MTASAKIRNLISTIPPGKPFPAAELRHLSSTENIRQILNRLVKAGELKRVARGIFMRPIAEKEIPLSAFEVAKTLAASTGEIISIHGAEAARQLQLSTQVPLRLVLCTSGNTRTLKIANRTVKLRHINPSRLIAPMTKPGLVITALAYLGKENISKETIKIIQRQISKEEFNTLLNLIPRMPAWMADLFYYYRQGKNNG